MRIKHLKYINVQLFHFRLANKTNTNTNTNKTRNTNIKRKGKEMRRGKKPVTICVVGISTEIERILWYNNDIDISDCLIVTIDMGKSHNIIISHYMMMMTIALHSNNVWIIIQQMQCKTNQNVIIKYFFHLVGWLFGWIKR